MLSNDLLLNLVDESIVKIQKYKEIAEFCEISIQPFEEALNYFSILREALHAHESLTENYLQQLQVDSSKIMQSFKFKTKFEVSQIHRTFYKINVEKGLDEFKHNTKVAIFNLNIFIKFNFFNDNIVAIGENGSGKSTLSAKLKEYLPKSAMTISAQKLLIIPIFKNITNPNDTIVELHKSQFTEKSTRFKLDSDTTYSKEADAIKNEFKVLLNNLLSEHNTLSNKYVQAVRNGEVCDLPVSRLINTIEIWNSLIEHRVLECSDGINITLKTKISEDNYPAYQMSDGEKVVLYYIAHVLQAPQDGFVIVDEPEMYLHKTGNHPKK